MLLETYFMQAVLYTIAIWFRTIIEHKAIFFSFFFLNRETNSFYVDF